LPAIRFRRKIRQSGGSSAIVIPPEILEHLDWKIGDQIEIYTDNGRIIIEKSQKRT